MPDSGVVQTVTVGAAQITLIRDGDLPVAADELFKDVPPAAWTGHTPGHRCLVVESGGETFCFLGDLVHYPPLHVAEPDRVTAWDTEPALTPPARRRIAPRAVAGGWLLAAAHAESPALGRLRPDGHERWAWRPVDQ